MIGVNVIKMIELDNMIVRESVRHFRKNNPGIEESVERIAESCKTQKETVWKRIEVLEKKE